MKGRAQGGSPGFLMVTIVYVMCVYIYICMIHCNIIMEVTM